jgi:hypothetical protein
MKTIIGIDGGKSGAIAVARGNELTIYKMPKDSKSMRILFEQISVGQTFVFLEKVSAFIGENDAKKYAIIKMLNQVQTIKTTLEQMEIEYIEIASVTWQSRLGLKFKGIEKAQRKLKYWEWAKRYAHKNKVNKYAGDAVCILACGLKLIAEKDPLVSFEGMKQTDLF